MALDRIVVNTRGNCVVNRELSEWLTMVVNVLVLCIIACPVLASAAPENNADALKKELQTFLNGMADKHGYALQLGFKNAEMEFAVAAG